MGELPQQSAAQRAAGLPETTEKARAMAKAAIQTAAKSLNGMTLGSGLAIGGLALGLGGWQLGSAIDKATDHSYRALLAAEHWGARIAVWKSSRRRVDGVVVDATIHHERAIKF